jgi:hypothetical protein
MSAKLTAIRLSPEDRPMRLPLAVTICALIGFAEPAAADNAQTLAYAAKCKAASFARRGPGTLSTALRDAEIQRCIKNKGFLD